MMLTTLGITLHEKLLLCCRNKPCIIRWDTIPQDVVNQWIQATALTNQMACNLSSRDPVFARSFINFLIAWTSSSDPDSNPRESWKTKFGLLLKTNSSLMSCSPRCICWGMTQKELGIWACLCGRSNLVHDLWHRIRHVKFYSGRSPLGYRCCHK